ncbi:MAG: coproporphyrinogen-III oxidase family protein, partial [Hyphomicrobium sp.]|nr:coproporphyrinogen-III oxidase family protein [Hyphomicrobium sp.]
MRADDAGFGVYVHWPFCAQKCPYCDFNSHVRFGGIDEPRFRSAFLRELEHTEQRTGPRSVSSIFFGGGTPSLMQPETVGAILDRIAALWSVEPGAEITLEANPGSVEAARFRGYRAAGVNRVSLGVQSLRDDILKSLGRIHSAAEAKAAIEIARTTFERFSFDLIDARPKQTGAAWQEELREALTIAGQHLSL